MSAEMSTSQRDSPWATGPTLFAAALLVISGVWVLFDGTAAMAPVGTGILVLAGLSMVFQFLVLPLYPIWSLLVIVLDAAIIWALATDRGSRVADHG